MKKKYYLRGLGFGILITALLFTFALVFYKPTLSDDEIRKKAKALGMVEADAATTDSSENSKDDSDNSGSSADKAEEATAQKNADDAEKNATVDQATSDDQTGTDAAADSGGDTASSADSSAGNSSADSAQSTQSAQSAPVSGETAQKPTGTKSFTISGGADSLKVAEDLYRDGLIDNPIDFNNYLEKNGYDNALLPGTYQIAPDSSYEKIAHAISSK